MRYVPLHNGHACWDECAVELNAVNGVGRRVRLHLKRAGGGYLSTGTFCKVENELYFPEGLKNEP